MKIISSIAKWTKFNQINIARFLKFTRGVPWHDIDIDTKNAFIGLYFYIEIDARDIKRKFANGIMLIYWVIRLKIESWIKNYSQHAKESEK